MSGRVVSTAAIVGLIQLACVCKAEWPLQHPEALLGGHTDLQCSWYDGDNSTLQFSYALPEGMGPIQALDTLEEQVKLSKAGPRTAGRTCFSVVKKTQDSLVLVCNEPADGAPAYVWEFLLADRRVTATVGPASHLLQPTEGRSSGVSEPDNG